MYMVEDQIINDLGDKVKYFKINNMTNFHKSYLYVIHKIGLLDNLKEYIDKYLSLSNRKDYEYIGSGTTASCFRIGDYVFKLFHKKYNKEDIICPDLYLIVKTYERDYVRNDEGAVIGGIEVQPYLTKSARDIPYDILLKYREELRKMKYELHDSMIKGKNGDNTKLLDSYMDADCENPELLPEWFKKYPLVLVDRDLVKKK